MVKQKNELKLGVILTYINLFASNMVSILYTPFILRTLGQGEYGVYTLVWNIVNYLTVLDLGFSNAIIRYASRYKAEKQKEKEASLYGTFLIVYLVIGLIAIGICALVKANFSGFAKGLTTGEVETALQLIMIGSINIAVSFPFSVFRGIVNVSEKFTFIKVVDLIRTLLTPVTTFAVLLNGGGSVGLMWSYTWISVVVFVAYVYYSFAVLHQKISFKRCDNDVLKSISVYSGYIFLGMIVDKIYWGTDQIILSNKADARSIAVYSIGSSFPGYFISFSTAISGVLLPRITKVFSEKKENATQELSEWFIKVGRLQFWVLSLVLLGFIFVGKEFICIWAGNNYESAYWIALIIMIPSLIPLSQNVGISILQAQNKLKFRSVSYVFIAIFNIFVSLALVKKYGGIGCAIGTSLGTILGSIILMNIYYKKIIHLDILGYWKNFISMLRTWILPIIAGMIMKNFIAVTSYVSLLLFALMFGVLFFISAYFVGFNSYEKALVSSIIGRLKRNK